MCCQHRPVSRAAMLVHKNPNSFTFILFMEGAVYSLLSVCVKVGMQGCWLGLYLPLSC